MFTKERLDQLPTYYNQLQNEVIDLYKKALNNRKNKKGILNTSRKSEDGQFYIIANKNSFTLKKNCLSEPKRNPTTITKDPDTLRITIPTETLNEEYNYEGFVGADYNDNGDLYI